MFETPDPIDAELPTEPVHPEADLIGADEDTTAVPVLERALADSEERFLRLAAEYDNYRRRTTREKTEAFDRGAASFAERLLDVLDDVDRLAASDPATTTAETFRSAFDLFSKKLRKDLEAAGLERIEPMGVPFDPTLHDAVAVVAPETPEQDHTVKQTFQAGYRYKGTVIRAARVQVYSEQGVA
ncbi:MAG: nucleotide exchange factor GrpE [Gemmatimonadota bacterium]